MTPPETCPECGANVDSPPSKINPTFTVFKCGSIDEDGKHGQSLECELNVTKRQRDLLLELLKEPTEMIDPKYHQQLQAYRRHILHEYEARKDQVNAGK